MEKMMHEMKTLCRAQEDHGLAARKAGDIEAARRYFARAEAYAFAASTAARDIGDAVTAAEMDRAESLNLRRALAKDGNALAA